MTPAAVYYTWGELDNAASLECVLQLRINAHDFSGQRDWKILRLSRDIWVPSVSWRARPPGPSSYLHVSRPLGSPGKGLIYRARLLIAAAACSVLWDWQSAACRHSDVLKSSP